MLVTAKLDRACRDVADYLKLRAWCDKRGKRIVILNQPQLDNSTPAGRAMGTMTAVFAELEREMAKERNRERYAAQVEAGRWPGGRIPYGWRSDRDAAKLVPDDGGTADVLRTMADMAIAGKSNGQIRRWLNDSGHPTMRGNLWSTESVRKVLRSDYTAGLLGEFTAAQLRAALRSRTQTRGERVRGHMLLRVAYCRTCGSPLYAHISHSRPYGGYRCMKCGYYVRMDWLEREVAVQLLMLAGDTEFTEYVLQPGDDHQAAIHALERDIAALERITGTETVITAKQAEIKHLQDLPYDPDHYEPVGRGYSVVEWWWKATDQERGSYMRRQGVKAHVWKDADGSHVLVSTGRLR